MSIYCFVDMSVQQYSLAVGMLFSVVNERSGDHGHLRISGVIFV